MRFLKQTWGFFIPTILFAVVIGLLWCGKLDNTLAIGLLGTIATLYFGILKYKMENDKIFNELFTSFNARYNDELNDLINTLRLKSKKELSYDEVKMIIDYFNLCAEEYLWYSRNRIPRTVWRSWKAGMLENLAIKQVREVYLSEMDSENARRSYYGLDKELKIS
ncbi:hypothetical protein [Draconibacterium orientale]|uniref:hypothetical protein n=1 Tax=Draconibacterium orientale TaxID=1168034 RepID=UPI002A0A735D|nr:hypothetical protein [Draconibacterium orientale]